MPYKDSIKAKECKHRSYLKHRDERIKAAILWAKNNPEKRKNIMKVNNERGKIRKRLWAEKDRYDGNATTIGKKCYLCEGNFLLAVHHIDGQNGKFGRELNNESSNLIILCVSCHGKVHNKHYRKEFYEYAR